MKETVGAAWAVTPLAMGQLSHLPTRKESGGSELPGSGPEDRKATFFNHKDITFVFTDKSQRATGHFTGRYLRMKIPLERLLWVMFSSLSRIHSQLCTVAPQKLSRVTLPTHCHPFCLCSQPK